MANIFKAMIPDKVYKGFDDIPFESLYDEGYRCIFLDYDNTIGPDRTWEPTEYSKNIVAKLKDYGFVLCLVSNAKSQRSSTIAQLLGIPCVTCAHKPRTGGIKRALDLMKVSEDKVIMIGDQIFTDVMAGKLSGIYTILVEKYSSKEVWYVVIKRPFEKIVRLIARF